MSKAAWYVRTHTCDNGIVYKTKFPVSEKINYTKSKKRKREGIARAEKCVTDASHELGRLLNCNFKTGIDFHLVLTYSEKGLAELIEKAGTDEESAIIRQAKKEYDNCLKRVKYQAKKKGIMIKAAAVTSNTDPKTGKAVRIHHHVVATAAAAPLFVESWKAGEVRGRELYSKNPPDLQELADYMIAQSARVGADKRYTHTRNLNRAEVSKPVKARNPAAELKVPSNCREIWRSEYKIGRPQNIRYYRPPIELDVKSDIWKGYPNGVESKSTLHY